MYTTACNEMQSNDYTTYISFYVLIQSLLSLQLAGLPSSAYLFFPVHGTCIENSTQLCQQKGSADDHSDTVSPIPCKLQPSCMLGLILILAADQQALVPPHSKTTSFAYDMDVPAISYSNGARNIL